MLSVVSLIKEEHIYVALVDVCGIKPNMINLFKTWVENDIDELDTVAIVMYLEKKLNIIIDDDMIIKYFSDNCRLIDLPGFKYKKRTDSLEIILG